MSSTETPEVRQRNPFELALWVVGSALFVAAVAAIVYFAMNGMDSEASICDPNGKCTYSTIFLLRQLTFMLAPSLASGGVITLAVALAFHAIDWSSRNRATVVAVDLVDAVPTEPTPVPANSPVEAAAATSAPRRSLKPDHRAFMRPSE